jgi:two-component system, sensor histidine kinase and response regulator
VPWPSVPTPRGVAARNATLGGGTRAEGPRRFRASNGNLNAALDALHQVITFAAPTMADEPGQRPTILVVDDNPENLALASASLEDEEYRVVTVSSGDAALREFDAHRPDCVLLDVRMPGMNGFEVCTEIRSRPGGADTPVVFLTAQRDVDTFDAALRAGGDDFLTKPVRPTELVLRVQAALRLGRLNAENREYFSLAKRQRDDLIRLQLQKERLTAFVVHDLKNPVGNIDLQAQLILRDETLSSRSREMAAGIRAETRSLMRLIMNLLDIAKSEEGRLSPTRVNVDLEALVSDVFEASSAAAKARSITLERKLDAARWSADGDLLRRVLENLLDNALRHAPEDSTVRLASTAEEGQLSLRITDQGRGVPAEMRDRIFDPFVQVESKDRSTSRSGRGLGLAFCRLAVEAHGGRIWVEDANPGAVFCVSLPHAH